MVERTTPTGIHPLTQVSTRITSDPLGGRMHPLFVILIMGCVVAGAVYLMKPKPVFVVEINNGHATVTQGNVSRQFLVECERISSMFNLADGRIEGCVSGKRVRLRFSKSIPREYHQNFRNVWYAMQA